MAEGLADRATAEKLLTPTYPDRSKPLRYYQEIAVNRAVQAVVSGRKRTLLTLCTGSGKTAVAFQIAWKLWSARWNTKGAVRRPKMLFLADRNVLVDDPMAKDFSVFGDARHKIAGGDASKSRDMYFATYQSIARDESRPGLYREYPRGFFDLVIVDECHRGSARDDSNWREILEWFEPATQVGMTATPRREDNIDTYAYFGDPIYEYSLAQGIDDGFLAPFRVHRVITDYDAAGWRPTRGELDRYGRTIPDAEYNTPDFERLVAIKARTRAIARHLAGFMRQTDRFAKTIVFCVDQEHALEMRGALAELNTETETDGVTVQERSVFGEEAKTLPYLLAQLNLLLHGLNAPRIDPGNALRHRLIEIGEDRRVNVILTNPPFGGEEEAGILNNFPDDRRTAETALLFLQVIMRRLKRGGQGRAAVVVPNGTLFGDGIAARIKADLLENFNLHTIVRLPEGVFAPYTDIPANLIFFDTSGRTRSIWYYEQPRPEGRRKYSKTAPLTFEEFAPCIAWWKDRETNERAWQVDAGELIRSDADGRVTACNLDLKNPHSEDAEDHRSPAEIVDAIIAKERRVLEIMDEIKATLAEPV